MPRTSNVIFDLFFIPVTLLSADDASKVYESALKILLKAKKKFRLITVLRIIRFAFY